MRTRLMFAASLSVALAATACQPDEREIPPRADAGAPATEVAAERGDKPFTVTGCLTAGPSQKNFVLTAETNPVTSAASRAATGTAPTFTYELVGGKNLGAHLNQQVTVQGRLDDEKDEAEFKKTEKTKTPAPAGADTPTVTSKEQVEVRVHRLYVDSMTPTSESCDSAAR